MTWRVLVADDDPEIGMLITKLLDKGSFDVTLCDDAESALVRIQRDAPYDLLISDYMLPGISGLELIEQVRRNRATARLPIVMISAHTNYAMDARAKEAGANAFLNKPFVLAHFRSTVHRLLNDGGSLLQRLA
ncbi:MAG TPA: response regulator [Candidatus Baltobacteraceae bacterium]|nr:response regulator [Candidatus Baltobacteraceae bacterium]